MRSSLELVLGVFVLSAAAACTATPESTPAAPQAAAEMDPAMMMQKMMELATPGEAHADLAKDVGKWEYHYKMKWDPNGPWMETTGAADVKTVLGGRFLQQDIVVAIPGMGEMEAIQWIGFDNSTGEYIALWADTFSTWWVESRGKADERGVINLTGIMRDVAGVRPYRMVIAPQDDGTVHGEMYDTIEGKEVLVMQFDGKKK
jgi:hypothetical protein